VKEIDYELEMQDTSSKSASRKGGEKNKDEYYSIGKT
jgi:hypothetical protein